MVCDKHSEISSKLDILREDTRDIKESLKHLNDFKSRITAGLAIFCFVATLACNIVVKLFSN